MVIVEFRGHLVPQYRACAVESLELGITCILYHYTRHPDLVSYAIPIFYIHLFVSSHYKITILKSADQNGAGAMKKNIMIPHHR